ncbi:MAG TPA: glucose-1-phosphate cytidylyltransferase [Patescibacteria group bacterium]|nr:glucose-1-phosphate cytidylyltransferase [Patescibacteria group bacterium]
MKAVILCGGKGTRLREETEYRPKPLVTIGGMPILWHIMKIYSHFGVKDFVLCLGYKGNMIKEFFLNFEHLTRNFTLDLRSKEARIVQHDENGLEDWRITFVDTGEESNTGSRVSRIEPFVRGETFFLTYGDGLADIDLDALLAFHRIKGKTVTLTGVHPESAYGILEHGEGLVKTFREKPRMDTTINGGFLVCEPAFFSYLSTDPACVLEQEPLMRLSKEGNLAVYEHPGFWYCMDTYKHYEDLNRRWQTGQTPWKVW